MQMNGGVQGELADACSMGLLEGTVELGVPLGSAADIGPRRSGRLRKCAAEGSAGDLPLFGTQSQLLQRVTEESPTLSIRLTASPEHGGSSDDEAGDARAATGAAAWAPRLRRREVGCKGVGQCSPAAARLVSASKRPRPAVGSAGSVPGVADASARSDGVHVAVHAALDSTSTGKNHAALDSTSADTTVQSRPTGQRGADAATAPAPLPPLPLQRSGVSDLAEGLSLAGDLS